MYQRQNQKSRNFKQGISYDDTRKKREEEYVQIRKNKRQEVLQKRRNIRTEKDEIPISESEVPFMAKAIWSTDIATQIEAVHKFRKLLCSDRHPPIETVVGSGIVPRLVEFLSSDNYQLQFESAWTLTNIASGSSHQTNMVVQANAIPFFVKLLSSPNDDVREQAIWALGNIAGDSIENRDKILQAGAMIPLLQNITDSAKQSLLKNAAWTLANLCRGKPPPKWDLVKPALLPLSQLVYSTDEELLVDACWTLSYLSDGSNDIIQAIIDSSVSRRIVELMMYDSYAVQTPALRTVGNIVTGDDMQTQVILNFAPNTVFLKLLNSPKKSIRKETCWTLSNITAGTKNQIQAVIELLPKVIELMSDDEYDVRREAAWVISNATSGGSEEQILELVDNGCFEPLCDLLDSDDPKLILVCLEGIQNILKSGLPDDENSPSSYLKHLEEAGGLDKLEELQDHPSEEVYKKAYKIMQKYCKVDTEDEKMAPAKNDKAYTLGDKGPSNFEF
eukprot:TRINITY_DN4803_c0_g1_i3.p1 TRINITY_DN4803_c0_g1~~TRINITY_DN4803_c0_g1_i3.p1  ORF type:complete len:504 (-),score=89.77 TRINITY_DN4803_c0_g1_i3:25-1536(-)